MQRKLYYNTKEEFKQFLDVNGYVPVKYKSCNTGEHIDYYINEDCNIIHVLHNRTEADVVWSKYTYNPAKSKNRANRHMVNIGFSAQLHRVIATTFLDNPPKDFMNRICFKDGNYDNCRPDNLEWCTHGDAMRQHYSEKSE